MSRAREHLLVMMPPGLWTLLKDVYPWSSCQSVHHQPDSAAFRSLVSGFCAPLSAEGQYEVHLAALSLLCSEPHNREDWLSALRLLVSRLLSIHGVDPIDLGLDLVQHGSMLLDSSNARYAEVQQAVLASTASEAPALHCAMLVFLGELADATRFARLSRNMADLRPWSYEALAVMADESTMQRELVRYEMDEFTGWTCERYERDLLRAVDKQSRTIISLNTRTV